MTKRKEREIKVVIANPEALPYARKKFTEMVYEAYIRSLVDKKDSPLN